MSITSTNRRWRVIPNIKENHKSEIVSSYISPQETLRNAYMRIQKTSDGKNIDLV